MGKGSAMIFKRTRKFWKVWADSLGSKAQPDDDHHSDRVAMVRTIVLLAYLLTNAFIVAGVVRHWNDVPPTSVQP